MKAEYWQLPEILEGYRAPIYEDLVKLLTAKVEYIQYCYSHELTEKQVMRLKQDEELIEKYAEYINVLSNQLEQVTQDYTAICDRQTELIHENNRLKMAKVNEIGANIKALLNHGKAAA